ncbi:bifunctional adenosylcobinamide kinase/adenosylcobinamide-phosphate guanylyltransferase [Jannaschia sp. LMIT008]|uniref:bifunctional adenosylcobinamide kinase/adenosylcobinamide-phosphate guanylyltransferase n=1 Tax=Jannaschia maritima TaxID=3032585 RepID=UPI0028119BF1|nr:bifunctional adenosylcobinamide kinase/adenosylcobinamide-phosphate guanylyltransferase [Jannaschia sp. LMIT008]
MSDTSKTTLVLGHAASGKSVWAERVARRAGGPVTYVATARVGDDEMAAKVARHAARRDADWTLVEAPADLATPCAAATGIVLIDCMTMWLTNTMMDDAPWEPSLTRMVEAMTTAQARFLVVSNDVGGGITPDNALARRFQREQGALNQRLAAACDRVVLVTAGLGQVLK